MANKTYVIKSYQFGYNDEYHYVVGTMIDSQYTDFDTAQKQYRQLEIKAARNTVILGEHPCFIDMDEDLLDKMEAFLLAKAGTNLSRSYYGRVNRFPDSLSDEDVLTFIEMTGMHSYQLIGFDTDTLFYAIWLPYSESYYMEYDMGSEQVYLIYKESQDELLDKEIFKGLVHDIQDVKLKGELDEISDNPVLLNELIKNNPYLSYSEKKKRIMIKKSNKKAYIELNSLLKKPLFEIKALTIEQLKALQDEGMNECEAY